jgi:hypothetical protein
MIIRDQEEIIFRREKTKAENLATLSLQKPGESELPTKLLKRSYMALKRSDWQKTKPRNFNKL